MIEVAATAAPALAVLIGTSLRGRRLARRHAASDRIEAAITEAASARADGLAVQLEATAERLVSAELDRDALQLVGAGLLRRAWRAERALAAVRARDEVAAYAERSRREVAARIDRVTAGRWRGLRVLTADLDVADEDVRAGAS